MQSQSSTTSYITEGRVVVRRTSTEIPIAGATEPIAAALDRRRGALFASSYEIPGRYGKSDIGFVDPPLAVVARGRAFEVQALNGRGRCLLPCIERALGAVPAIAELRAYSGAGGDGLAGVVPSGPAGFAEEDRTRQPSVFTVVRALLRLFASGEDRHLGLYGAFGYDLVFQIDPIRMRLPRDPAARDLVLYLPDALTVVDHRRERAVRLEYDFAVDWKSTEGLARDGAEHPPNFAGASSGGGENGGAARDHAPGEYAALVERAREACRRGDLFEVVPGQVFSRPLAGPPSELFARLMAQNPAPYGFLVNLGDGEHLCGASPEMFVRATGDRVETCPIAGTVARGRDPLEDAQQIERLLASAKDESELTMCTDVDRNDKSRVCVAGSVRILGRRHIELYSRLIHTVDHIEGRLRPGYDALDAFLSHAWAVTVTGAPKLEAMQFIEDHERSPRRFYGGAVGLLAFDGRIDSGLALRTIQITNGRADVRAGATLLYESDPPAEEAETELKAAALLAALEPPATVAAAPPAAERQRRVGEGKRVLLVDHRDSFVHTLAGYLRQTGAEVMTYRAGFGAALLDEIAPDLVVLSPGPGTPRDFGLSATLAAALARGVPVFGVCLGLQGIVEHFGGRLEILERPAHGARSAVRVLGGRLFDGLPRRFVAGRYHSLFARPDRMPPDLAVTAESDDGVPMAVEHAVLPVAGVQFHPESLLTMSDGVGLRIIENVMSGTLAPRDSR
jgi:anthranilate synthase